MTNANVTTSNINAATAQDDASDMIPGTGWSKSAAASMAKECAREDRLFGRRNRTTRRPSASVSKRALTYAAKLFAETGWTVEAVGSMHKEVLRDRRLFGGPAMYATV